MGLFFFNIYEKTHQNSGKRGVDYESLVISNRFVFQVQFRPPPWGNNFLLVVTLMTKMQMHLEKLHQSNNSGYALK